MRASQRDGPFPGLLRAPEVFQACKDGAVSRSPHVFTKAGDAYGFGMLCNEVLTGKLPFEGHAWNDYGLVLSMLESSLRLKCVQFMLLRS